MHLARGVQSVSLMATTLTEFTPAGRQFPFIGIGIPPAQFPTFIPSAELIFVIGAGAITVAAAGADQRIEISCVLPRSFCYVLTESSMRIQGGDGDDWDQGAVSNLTDSASAADKVSIPLVYDNDQLSHQTTTVTARAYRLRDPPSKVIVPLSTDDALFRVEAFNATIDGALATLIFFARFLRYDRNQAQFWQVNTPVLVR